jgi:hypothetical protein
MKAKTEKPPQDAVERYKQRIDTDIIVREALIKEQGKRQGVTGKRQPVKNIITEWLEEKARTVLGTN